MSVQQAEGQLQRDQAQLEAARVTERRYQTLLQQDSIARQDVDTQVALVKQFEAAVVTDRANIGSARLNLAYTRIVAPVAGRVGLRVIDAGNYISAGDSNGVAVITQIAPIDVQFSVPQDAVPQITQNAAAGTLQVAALDRARTTTLDTGAFGTLDNRIDTTTGTVKAKARFANAKGTLFPSQFVNVRLRISTIQGATVVPASAVRHGSTGDFVYVLGDDQTVSMRSVTRGDATTDLVVMKSGLEVGERVITEGGDRLRDGSRVQLPGQAASAASGASGRRQRGASGAEGGFMRRREGASGAHGPRAGDAASQPAP
jgi:multidrug efflux system membrane fusion protein